MSDTIDMEANMVAVPEAVMAAGAVTAAVVSTVVFAGAVAPQLRLPSLLQKRSPRADRTIDELTIKKIKHEINNFI